MLREKDAQGREKSDVDCSLPRTSTTVFCVVFFILFDCFSPKKMMSLFGKKKEPKAPSTADTLALLAENIGLLEKKQEHLQAKIAHETDTARKNASKNKRLALAALKRKKLYENQCNKLQDTIVTLQQQEIALQNLATNVEILGTMNQVIVLFVVVLLF
jgi:hypothetical protein